MFFNWRAGVSHQGTFNHLVDSLPRLIHRRTMTTKAAPDLDLIFAALADPTRRAMLTALLAGESNVSDLAAPFEISLTAISKHLRILAQAGLIEQERAGREKTCRLEPDGLNTAFIWMQGFGAFAGVDLEAVERLLDGLLGDDIDT